VLIKVAAVDVNPIDVYIRAGMIPANFPFPTFSPRPRWHHRRSGSRRETFNAGERVWVTGQGVEVALDFSEFSAVDERWLHATQQCQDEEIVALSLVRGYGSSWLGHSREAKSRRSSLRQRRLGGVGSASFRSQDSRANVITTAGSPKKSRSAANSVLTSPELQNGRC